MGNYGSNDAKGAGKDVIKQTEETSHLLYQYIDLKGEGKLVKEFRKSLASKNFDEVDKIIKHELTRFLYNEGHGQMVPIADLVQKRSESRHISSVNSTRNMCCGNLNTKTLKKTFKTNTSEVQLINRSFELDSFGKIRIIYFVQHIFVVCILK